MKRYFSTPLLLLLSLMLASAACRSTGPGSTTLPQWDLSRAEFLQWTADDPAFDQDHAIEASGMAAEGNNFWIASEKYARLLRLDSRNLRVRVEKIDLPEFSEVEGITLDSEHGLLMTDEAHAEIFVIGGDNRPHPVDLSSLGLQGDKDGIEGIASTNDGSERVFLLLERSRIAPEDCISTIFLLRWDQDRLLSTGKHIILPLEDCNWRLTALEYFRGHLLALKTRFPGPRYELISVNPRTGEMKTLLDLDRLIERAEAEGWHGNIEGMALETDGSLWIVSDNAMTHRVETEIPPVVRRKTLLLMIPAISE